MPLDLVYGAIAGCEEYAKAVKKSRESVPGDLCSSDVNSAAELLASSRTNAESAPELELPTKGWLN